MHGWQDTAPSDAIKAFERYQFVNSHPGWTYSDYDEADAGDILLDQEFKTLLQPLTRA